MKKALITGVTGQDGSYLAEFLLNKGYEVHGVKRRTSLFNTDRIDHLYQDPHINKRNFILHHGDLTDTSSLIKIIQHVQPDEIYNLAAQSHVAVSFEVPEYTANSDALGPLRILEAIRILKLEKKTKFYQASTSELFGEIQDKKQSEKTKFYPKSPYATSKLFGYWITKNYRESYDMHASNGIFFIYFDNFHILFKFWVLALIIIFYLCKFINTTSTPFYFNTQVFKTFFYKNLYCILLTCCYYKII